jgi:hypothetical protein
MPPKKKSYRPEEPVSTGKVVFIDPEKITMKTGVGPNGTMLFGIFDKEKISDKNTPPLLEFSASMPSTLCLFASYLNACAQQMTTKPEEVKTDEPT